MNNKIVRTQKIVETINIGKEIAHKLQGGDVIFLHGDLGSGKTTLVQGIAEAFGVNDTSSPTFLIIHEYQVKNNTRIDNLYHADLYRVSEVDRNLRYQLKEMLEDKRGIVLIEWPEKIDLSFIPSGKHIYFTFIDENTREMRMENI